MRFRKGSRLFADYGMFSVQSEGRFGQIRESNDLKANWSRPATDFLQLIIERIDYDGRTGEIEIFFHDTGIKALKVAETPDEQGQVA